MSQDVVLLEVEGPVATLTVARPAALNALNRDVLQRLHGALRDLSDRDDVRAILLTGAGGKAFVAGADIAEMRDMGPLQALDLAELGNSLLHYMETMPQPILAVVNGFALGGGCELAMACDFIYAADTARFGQPEVNLGLIPGFGGTQRMARLVGAAVARELIFTGRILDAPEALRIGLVNAVFPAAEVMGKARETALLIAAKGRRAVTAAKRAIRMGADRDLVAACELESQAFSALFDTDDAREGMAAFLERRPARFGGA